MNQSLPARPSTLRWLYSPPSRAISLIKAALFVISLFPLAWLVQASFFDALGVNPVETIERTTGDWCLRFLLFTLAVTPLRRFAHINWLIRLRRMLGLFAFFYGCLHFLAYIGFDQNFSLTGIGRDIVKRPFVTAGFTALLLMLPLALTSFDAAIRWLGSHRWQRLHRLVYPTAILGVVHYWWLVKRDIREPLLYALIVAGLLGIRLWWKLMKNGKPKVAGNRNPS